MGRRRPTSPSSGSKGGWLEKMARFWSSMPPSGDVPIRLSIVAGSGRRAWAGISGDFSIDVAPDGSHSYTIDYTLGDSNVGEP